MSPKKDKRPTQEEIATFVTSLHARIKEGRVMLVVRSVPQASRKIITISADGATGWTKPVFHEQLRGPICMASVCMKPTLHRLRAV